MIKKIGVFMMTAAVMAAVMGCSSGTKETEAGATEAAVQAQGGEGQAEKGEKIKISYLSRYTNPELPRAAYYMKKLDEFRAQNPNIEVEDISIADAESYKKGPQAAPPHRV